MGRKPKHYATNLELIQRILFRRYNQELAGQTKQRHYTDTKDEQVACALCFVEGVKLHRHRIIPGGLYTDANVLVVCVVCHKLIHKMINELRANNEEQFRMAIMLAKMEVSSRA